MEKITAVVLAAGAGKRMHSDVHKQYMMLAGRPVLFYALQAFAESAVTDIVVVVGAGEIDYCRKEIVEKYHIQKVCAVVEGGRERYHSVYEGLKAACEVFGRKGKLRLFFHVSFVSFVQSTNLMKNTGPEE